MVLSNKKIKALIESRDIFVGKSKDEPFPMQDLKFQTMAMDLHLGPEFSIWKPLLPGEQSIFTPSDDGFELQELAGQYAERAHLESDGSYVLKSKGFVLAKTMQYIRLPDNISARVEGRSTLARLGIGVHVTAPTIHARFEGTITLEIFNQSPRSVRLVPWMDRENPGLRICQLIFEDVRGDVEVAPSSYDGQTTAMGVARDGNENRRRSAMREASNQRTTRRSRRA